MPYFWWAVYVWVPPAAYRPDLSTGSCSFRYLQIGCLEERQAVSGLDVWMSSDISPSRHCSDWLGLRSRHWGWLISDMYVLTYTAQSNGGNVDTGLRLSPHSDNPRSLGTVTQTGRVTDWRTQCPSKAFSPHCPGQTMRHSQDRAEGLCWRNRLWLQCYSGMDSIPQNA